MFVFHLNSRMKFYKNTSIEKKNPVNELSPLFAVSSRNGSLEGGNITGQVPDQQVSGIIALGDIIKSSSPEKLLNFA